MERKLCYRFEERGYWPHTFCHILHGNFLRHDTLPVQPSRTFALLVIVSMVHQMTLYNVTMPSTTFCAPSPLFEWLVMPQRSHSAPGWFVNVLNVVAVVKRLACVFFGCYRAWDNKAARAYYHRKVARKEYRTRQSQQLRLDRRQEKARKRPPGSNSVAAARVWTRNRFRQRVRQTKIRWYCAAYRRATVVSG